MILARSRRKRHSRVDGVACAVRVHLRSELEVGRDEILTDRRFIREFIPAILEDFIQVVRHSGHLVPTAGKLTVRFERVQATDYVIDPFEPIPTTRSAPQPL